jgi:sulfur carrier protein
MIITVNGTPRDSAAATLADLLAEVPRGSAAAVDGEVVPRGEWASFELTDGQSVEILTAVQGG